MRNPNTTRGGHQSQPNTGNHQLNSRERQGVFSGGVTPGEHHVQGENNGATDKHGLAIAQSQPAQAQHGGAGQRQGYRHLGNVCHSGAEH